MHRFLLCLAFFPIFTSSADAALTITIAPDGAGGTTYSFAQTSANPAISTAQAMSSSLRIELPPEMFNPSIAGGPGSSDTSGTFSMIARFQDAGSGITYDVVGLQISNVLSYAFFGFHRSFSQAPSQTEVQFVLVPGAAGILGISPTALVEGSHSIGSLLFGTVTVNVIPEPSCGVMMLLGSCALLKRRRPSA